MPREDEGLRRLALERLGALAPALAREAVEHGIVEVEPDVLAWEGSRGTVRAHRVVLRVPPELCARVNDAPSVVDALTAALAAAVSAVAGNALAELRVLPGEVRPRTTAYRGGA
jgi:hypothetical protein